VVTTGSTTSTSFTSRTLILPPCLHCAGADLSLSLLIFAAIYPVQRQAETASSLGQELLLA
jgi:hypothetical protein